MTADERTQAAAILHDAFWHLVPQRQETFQNDFDRWLALCDAMNILAAAQQRARGRISDNRTTANPGPQPEKGNLGCVPFCGSLGLCFWSRL